MESTRNNPANELFETDFHLLPNWKIVQFKILEAHYNLTETFAQYLLSQNDHRLRRRVIQYIINLYSLIKHYDNITKKLDNWKIFSTMIDQSLLTGKIDFKYDKCSVCVNRLNEAVHASGLTDIQREKRDPGKAMLDMAV